ncbi:MAG: hypothetical protein NWP98_11090, partial [Erythrobacter sp.]|nr:hypothetical protein [Erythrobacter sp.]
MIAFQPDLPMLSGALPSAGVLAQPEARAGAGAGAGAGPGSGMGAALDFAGLVNAALPGGKVSAAFAPDRSANGVPDAPILPD